MIATGHIYAGGPGCLLLKCRLADALDLGALSKVGKVVRQCDIGLKRFMVWRYNISRSCIWSNQWD